MFISANSHRRTVKMSGTEETFHYTKEDIRKLESREARIHGGTVPADAESSILKVRNSLPQKL